MGSLLCGRPRGHLIIRLALSGGGGAVICLRCGGYGTCRARKLGKPCCGRLSDAGRAALKRVVNGKHPCAGSDERLLDSSRADVRDLFNER